MKKLVNLFAIAVLFSATSFAQTGSLEEVLNWLETECAEDTTGLAEYCDLLELAIACGEGDTLACIELEAGVNELLNDNDTDGSDETDEGDESDEITEWLNWLEEECAENPDSEACVIIATATACIEGDSLACEELELLIDGMDWDWDGDDDDDYGDDDDDDYGDDDDDYGDDDDDYGDDDDDDYGDDDDDDYGDDDDDYGDDDDDYGDDDDDYGDDDDDDYGDDDDNGWDVEGWLMYLEMECAEDSTSVACDILSLAVACLDGDSIACEELEVLLDELDWDDDDWGDDDDDDEDGDDDDDEDGDDDDDEDGDDDDDEDSDDDDDEDGDDDDDEDGDDDDDEDGDGDDDEDGDDTGNVTECNAMFEVTQALTEDSIPMAGSVWIYIFDYNESLSYAWDFGDEGTSNEPFPTWTYNTDGPYTICLTVSDSLGTCSDTYCESISVDSLGMLGGFMSGFTINVLDGGESSGTPANVTETIMAFDDMVVYPNPTAEDLVRIRWNALQNGTTVATLYDLRGTQVVEAQITSWTGENQVELNIAHLDRGYYLVQLAMGDLRMTQRLVIQ